MKLATTVRSCLRVTLLATFALAGSLASAQDYPNRPIRMIVPFGPGGTGDVVARLVSDRLSQGLGKPVTVENRPGADGTVGMQAVASSKPDGYTLIMNVGSAHTLSPVIYKNSPDPIKDFEPISLVSRLGFLVVVNEKNPARTFQEYITYARANQNKTSMSAGSSGVALISEKFKRVMGMPDAVIASYKGPGFPAVLSGEVDMTIDAFNAFSLIKAGKLRALAVLSPKRIAVLPDVPTMDELGVKGMNFTSWAGLLAPAGTPKPIIARLHKEITAVLANPDVVVRFAAINHEIVGNTPAEFAAQIVSDLKEWREIVQATGFPMR